MKLRSIYRLLALITVIAALTLSVPYVQAEDKETPGTPAPEFTEEEKKFIASQDVIRIGYIQDRIPVSFTDKNGEFAGISRYIFDRVSELCGLRFEYVELPEGEVTYDFLLDQKLNLVSSVDYNEENKHARGILMSNPYLSSRKVVVARKGLEFSFDSNLSIAIQTGSQTIRKVLKESYPNFEPVDYASISECFDAVRSGKADLMMQNQYIVEYWISKPIYEDLNVIPVLGLDDNLCFSAVYSFDGRPGPTMEDGTILIGILDKTIALLTDDEISSFTIKAITEHKYTYTFSDFMYRYRFAVTIFAISVVVILVLMILLARQRMRIAEDRANDNAKSRFLSTMNHEIRTPLNGLIGLNHLMSQKLNDPEKLSAYLSQSTVTADYLLSLINDMLDMSSIQSRHMELAKRPADLGLLLNTVNSITVNAASDKGLIYESDFKLEYGCLNCDPIRVQQVLLNLLDDAKKFTPEGGKVELTVTQKKLENEKILTTAVITDTGRGMSEEFQKHIFNTFEQELDTVSKGNQGTGLGLSISRRLAQLMGGDIDFVSKKGEGSSFTFTFTAEIAEMPASPAPLPETPADTGEGRPTRVLVAEDNELNGEIIMELLREGGFEAVLSENGREALQTFDSSTPGEFGIILMDLLMPEMDGFEAAKAIRALERPDAKTVKIYACSANCSDADREKALSFGMDDFIKKPINVDELMRKLSE